MADFPQFEPVISRNGRHKTQEDLARPTNHDVTHSNHRMEKLEEKFKIIKDILVRKTNSLINYLYSKIDFFFLIIYL